MIFVDGVNPSDGADPPVFRHVATSGTAELQALMKQIAERIGRMLEKRGLIERDSENAWLSSDPSLAGSLDDLIGSSITGQEAHRRGRRATRRSPPFGHHVGATPEAGARHRD